MFEGDQVAARRYDKVGEAASPEGSFRAFSVLRSKPDIFKQL
jgi:hypothetical protein